MDKQIEAIQSVNKRFESDVIVDGKKVSATVKSDANFDQLSSDLLKTGNAKLDTLLQSAITDGKEQLEQATTASSEAAASSSEVASSSSSSSEAPDSSTEASDSEQSQTEASSTTQEASSDTSTPATASVSGATSYGITSYNPAILQRNLSRVPYNESAIADSSNPAWTFAPGVLKKIIDTSHARGYFSGNDFILEKSISSTTMVTTICSRLMELICSLSTVKRVTSSEMPLVIQMSWITKTIKEDRKVFFLLSEKLFFSRKVFSKIM